MKIAVLHNFMDNIGGAERVCLTLARELDATLISTNFDYEKIAKMGFENIKTKTIGKVPVNAPFRQQITFERFRSMDLSKKFDFFIIGGEWATSSTLKNKPNMVYVHSPIREFYDLYEYTRKTRIPWYMRPFFDFWVGFNRGRYGRFLDNSTVIVANSINTSNRLEKYLGKKSHIVNPPIDVNKFNYQKNEGFWLSVNRLLDHKRIDIQFKAFQKMPDEKLVVVGSYEKSKRFMDYKNYLEKIKPDNVKIISWANQDELVGLYSTCKGLITTALDEDFGMAPVEAMASGKPVIGPNEGGYRETVISGETGLLIDNLTVEKLVESIKKIGLNPENYRENCIKRAKEFDTEVFIGKIMDLINQQVADK